MYNKIIQYTQQDYWESIIGTRTNSEEMPHCIEIRTNSQATKQNWALRKCKELNWTWLIRFTIRHDKLFICHAFDFFFLDEYYAGAMMIGANSVQQMKRNEGERHRPNKITTMATGSIEHVQNSTHTIELLLLSRFHISSLLFLLPASSVRSIMMGSGGSDTFPRYNRTECRLTVASSWPMMMIWQTSWTQINWSSCCICKRAAWRHIHS